MDIRLPNLGEGADSGTVVNVLVKVGDSIAKDQPVLELETEKAVGSIPSPVAGKVTKILVKEGEKISAGRPIMSVDATGEVAPAAPAPAPIPAPLPATKKAAAGAVPAGLPVAASPTIRRMARDLGIDLTVVPATGRGGRIELEDLKNFIAGLQQAAAAPAKTAAREAAPLPDFAKWGPVTRKPISSLRKVIGERMTESWTTVPHVTQFDEADITGIMALRKKHLAAYEKAGVRLTVTAFLLKAVALTLKTMPQFNASLDETAGELVVKEYVHLGVAVDTEQGLIVPVLRDADKKSLLELSRELTALAEKTRARKVALEELKGSSFTVSNLGGIGGTWFTPIVNKPDVAILGVGRGVERAAVVAGTVVPRVMLPLALSYDHRVIDGADGARFIRALVEAVERFEERNVAL
jgi:pyruvate dehydrogenase E2 component (dihydrolipoamide acetyltransferase)